ncbi:copper chaperone of lysine biosynthesis protein [Tulasnella sp. 419]|nr:copper chaperone of lysine biosynthesis protein [Tulasnella sp. 419]
MQVWLVKVPFESGELTEALFERAIQLVDEESRAKIRRFYHAEDRWRCLVGRLLPRHFLLSKGIKHEDMKFDKTDAGKPFLSAPQLGSPFAFNITHDSKFVGMAFSTHSENNDIGIDLMRVEIPKGETVKSFADILEDQLSHHEQIHLRTMTSRRVDGANLIFKYWTIKEAYTKALGHGLGFDFSRIEYDETASPVTLSVEGKPLVEWCIRGFSWSDGGEQYLGVVAQPDEGGRMELTWTPIEQTDWIKVIPLIDLVN